MRAGAAPLWEQLAILIIGPPIMAAFFWLMSRGWALGVQGGTASDKTKQRQKIEFWMLLVAMYVIGLGMALYAWLA